MNLFHIFHRKNRRTFAILWEREQVASTIKGKRPVVRKRIRAMREVERRPNAIRRAQIVAEMKQQPERYRPPWER